MKKLYLLTMVMLLASTLNAQTTWRKSWDFTKWSAATVANLKADNAAGSYGADNNKKEWTDAEKTTDAAPTELSKDNCFWKWGSQGSAESTDFLQASGTVIKELEGLYYTNTAQGSLAIAVDYQGPLSDKDGFGPYQGASYLWLGGKNKNYFVIPHVPVGETVKIGVESHNTTASRGIDLYIGRGTSGKKLVDPDGNDVPKPTVYQDLVWMVPADVEPVNDDGTVDLTIRNSDGCHLYYITVGDGDTPKVDEAKKVAYVGSEEDMVYFSLSSAPDRVEVTVINPDVEISLDSLQTYEAVVVSPELDPAAKMAAVLKSAIAYQPMLNLNAALYEAWGLGKTVASDEKAYAVAPAFAEDEAFVSLSAGDFLLDGTLSSIELGSYFAADAVVANLGEAVGIHLHNAARNSYMGMAVAAGTMLNPDVNFIVDAAVYVAESKKNVTAVIAPEIKQVYGNLATEVTISCATANSTIYYTTDGTEPTVASAVYENPFTLTEAKTVKTLAVADGFLPSAVTSVDVEIFAQTAAPVFTMTKEAASTTVEIASATEGAKVYYSYLPFTEVSKAQEYTAPIVLSQEPSPIYAMATADKCVASDLAEDYVAINSLNANTIRMDTVAHFNAATADWYDGLTEKDAASSGDTKTFYYFGKKAWNYFSTDVDHTETVKGSDGQDSVITYYKPNPEAKKVAASTTDTDWRLTTAGQVLILQSGANCSDQVGNGAAGYYAETAEDMIGGAPSKCDIQFGGKNGNDPYTGAIESTKKFTAPFDVVTYIASGKDKSTAEVELQISADGETWEKAGDLNISNKQRYYKKSRVGVEKEGDFFVRVAHKNGNYSPMVYDVIVLNNGELSKKYEVPSGIEDITAGSAEVLSVEIYDLNGIRLAEPATGVNIVRTVYTDGTVKTEKVLNR